MDKVKLKDHKKIGDTFYTPYTEPEGFWSSKLKLTNWSKDSLPEYLWIGFAIYKLGRKEGLLEIYNMIQELRENEICIPQFSRIIKLDIERKQLFWSIVFKYIPKEILSPLTVIFTPDVDEVFYDLFFDFSMDVDSSISCIFEVVKECQDFHDELTADIAFAVDWFYIINNKLKILAEVDLLSDALSKYWIYDHCDEVMKMYRPSIRSVFKSLGGMHENYDVSTNVWRKLGEISRCNQLILAWECNNNMEYYKNVGRIIEYIDATNEDKKLESKYTVIMGITCYIYKIYGDIINKNLENDVSGRILFRTMVESYINLKYIMTKESEIYDIYDRFKAYGVGKYKLVMAKLREGKYFISENSQIEEKLMEMIVNEDVEESFVNMSVGYFDKIPIKNKFLLCDEDELYEIYYEYGNNFVHGFWGAVRESSLVICDNPSHNYHVVPDYSLEQNVKSINYDCEMIMKKLFNLISTYIEIPESFIN